MPPEPTKIKRRPAYGEKHCPHCDRVFNVRGYGMHEKACRRTHGERVEPALRTIGIRGGAYPELGGNDNQTQIAAEPVTEDLRPGVGESEDPSVNAGASGAGLGARIPNVGDTVIEDHQAHSRRSDTRTLSASSEESKELLSDHSKPTETPDTESWRPFRSREDYEFAELVQHAALNRTHTERLIKLLQRCQDSPGSFTLRDYDGFKTSLESYYTKTN